MFINKKGLEDYFKPFFYTKGKGFVCLSHNF
ncbi:hypothetical protein SAMN06295967_106125 [Belliella buryatensis]|uniref:Uncharacterized protein n=1 Tax=Belliella buryatensis TaxID=1500549 RepID=A0A239D6D7_9BACT|nr:hypothetical protein SAMN06295967_106125 [Belliella buryatensis]